MTVSRATSHNPRYRSPMKSKRLNGKQPEQTTTDERGERRPDPHDGQVPACARSSLPLSADSERFGSDLAEARRLCFDHTNAPELTGFTSRFRAHSVAGSRSVGENNSAKLRRLSASRMSAVHRRVPERESTLTRSVESLMPSAVEPPAFCPELEPFSEGVGAKWHPFCCEFGVRGSSV